MHNPVTKTHLLGVSLVLFSALAFSVSGVLTKSIEADAWVVASWRGGFAAILISFYAWSQVPKGKRLKFGWRGWVLASLGSASSLAFIASFKLTYVANVAVITAILPFAAALLEGLFLRQKVRRVTMVASVFCLTGVLVMAGGSVGSVEVPLAILLAWVVLAEVPPMTSLIGGGVVFAAILWHSVGDYRRG